MKKLLVALCSAVIVLLAFAGCGGYTAEDAKGLVEGSLQVDFYGEITDEFVASVENEKEELEADYEANIDYYAESFLEICGITDPTDNEFEEFRTLSKDLLAKAKWEIGEVEETDRGYMVPVTMYPLDVVDQINNNLQTELIARSTEIDASNMTEDEITAAVTDIAVELIKGYIENADYLDAIEVEVEVYTQEDENGETYFMMDSDDYIALNDAFMGFEQ